MKKVTIAKIALFFTAVLWGSTFTIGKIASEVFSPSFIIALRFLIASIALLIVAYPQRKQLDKKYFHDGLLMGITLFASYILQVGGLALDTSPGKSAFLCTTYSVMVPFLYWFITKEKPKARHIICVFLCLIGVGLLSLQGGWGMSMGDILTVLSGVPCAINIVICSIVCKDRNVLLLTTIELWVVTILAWLFVFIGNGLPNAFPLNAVAGITFLGLFATALCLYLQSYGLKYAEPAIGGMILSLESVFGVIFSMMIYHEHITLRMLIGFIVIFVAIVLSQLDDTKKLEISKAINRIKKMEAMFEELVNCNSNEIHENAYYKNLLNKVIDYYENGLWLKDYELDEKGLLPSNLKRGILSQDVLYNFLEDINY